MEKPTRRKWKEYYDLPEIENIRKLIKDTYSNKLEFIEESHQYFLDGIEYDCVSNITHRFKKTNQLEMAERCYKKGLKDPGYKYAGMTVEEILAAWKKISGEACDYGSEVHEFGESMFYYMAGEDDKILPSAKDKFKNGIPAPSNPLEVAVVKFWNDIPENIVPVLAETKVFNSSGTPYAGTFDILFYYVSAPESPKNGLMIFDYKTNGALATNGTAYTKMTENYKGTTLAEPFSYLLDCSESFYKLQLACYQIPLENIGLKVIGRRLIWLHPNGTYEKLEEPDMAKAMRNALDIPKAKDILNTLI